MGRITEETGIFAFRCHDKSQLVLATVKTSGTNLGLESQFNTHSQSMACWAVYTQEFH